MNQFPTHLARFREAEIVSVNTTINPNSKAYKSIKRKSTLGHHWELTLETVSFDYELACELQAFVNSIGGQFGDFYLYNPVPALGVGGGSPVTRVALEQNATSIPVESLPASTQKVWKAFDFIQFSNHEKAYQVVYSVNTNGTGETTVTIFPPLITDVPEDTVIKFGSDVNFKLELENDSNDIAFSVQKGRRGTIEIAAKEVP